MNLQTFKNSRNHLIGIMLTAAALLPGAAQALTVTQTGTFTTDNQIYQLTFSLATASPVAIYTTSYGGGVNANGTTSASGGFVPNLTLFTSSGSIVAADGGSATSRGTLRRDPATGLYNDAYLSLNLAAGNYILDLTEFPNVAIGNMSDGFLFASSPNITGSFCGASGGSLLETDLAPCVQRTGNFAVNVNTPEPATFFLAIPALGVAYLWRRRLSSRA